MNRDIRLYLGGQQIEWSKIPDILLTYQRTDYQNPTITKNSYSKQIEIDGTPTNNNIFNHIWQLDRIMDEGFTLFNPSQRVGFELYNDAEIVEKGYAKLDSIKKDGYKIRYGITLYGGLGAFLYALGYDVNTDKEKTLASLNYLGTSNPDDEFNFFISKDAINTAWDALRHYGSNSGDTRMWDYITFVPCYNGIPSDFDADKVLINTNGLGNTKVRYTNGSTVVNDNFPMHISDDENSYSTMNGFVTGKMRTESNEWKMRDLRSYLQRPALSIKGFFNAIRDPQNNGGYNVVLDRDFFSQDNPYYWNAFMTLPMLKPETDGTDEYIPWEWYKEDEYIYTGDWTKEITWKLASMNVIDGTPDSFYMDVEIHATITGATADKLYTSALNNNGYDPNYDPDPEQGDPPNAPQLYYYGCTAFQMYGFGDAVNWQGASAKCGSNLIVLTSKLNGQYIGTQSINTWWGDRPYNESDTQFNFGYWKKVSGSDYVWHNETDDTDIVHIQMDSNLMSFIPNIAIAFSNINIMNGALSMNQCGKAYAHQYYEYQSDMNEETYQYWNRISFTNIESNIVYKVNGKMRSFQPVTKKDLLGGFDGTPADMLLSYCKLFGLYIEKDRLKNTIYIKMRNNWYEDEVVDLEDLIDRSKPINVTPLTFESKWYNFQYAEANGKLLDKYASTYSQPFGKQLIDTKYNFDAEEIDLIEDTKFRNGLTALEKSNYYNTKSDVNGNQIPQCLFDWITVEYYNDINTTLETNMCLPSIVNISELNSNTPKEFYDFLPKLQIHDADDSPTDGDGILVFFNGIRNTGNADYWLSDDVDEMFIDSERPCWLQTVSEWNEKWTNHIALHITTLPEFNRYCIYNNIITAAWDFGYTKELYVPYYGYDPQRTPTLYQNFWKSYIADLYSVNTRIVNCNVAINQNDVYGFMKKFYWWDNCLWVCTKVSDFDIALDKSTQCSFTKVNSKDAYLEMPTFNDRFFNFYRINGNTNIPAQGTDEERSFMFGLDSSSNWEVFDNGEGFASFDPNYPTSGSFGTGYEIKAKYLPNYSPSPRYALYTADNHEGTQLMIRVWQDGYTKEKYLKLEPNSIVLPRVVTEPVTVDVDSSANWFCVTGNWVIIDTVTGTTGVTSISVSATTNSGDERTLQVLFTNADGISTTLNVTQRGSAKVTLEQHEIFPVTTVPASGGNVFYRLKADVETEVRPMGNTENYAVASGQVTYHTTNQPTSGTNFWIHFSPNTSTVTRNAGFYAYYEEDGGRYAIYPTIVPLPLVQLANGNTTVELSDKGQGVTTGLGGSGMSWTATTNDSWITIITTSGTGSDASVEYTVEGNTGNFRTGYIYVTYADEMGFYCQEVIVIKQAGVNVPWVVEPTAVTVDYRGGYYQINVSSPNDFTLSSDSDWSTAERNRDGKFTIHISENEGYARTMNIYVTSGGETKTVVVNQGSRYPDEYVLDYVPQQMIFEASGGTIQITIRSDSDWTIENNE